RLAAEVFAAAHLLDDELLTLFGADDFGSDRCALQQGRTELRVAVAADGQHGIERELLSGWNIAVVNDHFLAFFDFVLMATVTNDGVHDSLSRSGSLGGP